jgi:nucleoid-associated protein
MALNKLIVHELIKESGIVDTTTITSNELIPVNDESDGLVDSLLKSYQGDKILYAEFDQSPGRYFPERFDKYRKSTRTDQEFITFTIDVLGNLVPIIQAKILAKGGYLVFAEYEHSSINFVVIFLIRDTEGKLLRRVPNSFEIKTVEYLDTSHLAMACRINENKLALKESNYISFTRHRQQDVSDYFTDWINVQRLESSTEFTKALYKLINEITPPTNSETNKQYSIDEVRNMVYEIASNNAQHNINIHSLSEQIYGDPNTISSFADKNQISIDTEFRYDKNALRKFIQLNINKDGINLKFSRGDSGTKVRISEEDPNIILIESQKFANALRAELDKE